MHLRENLHGVSCFAFFPTGEDGITPLMWSAVKNQFRIAVFLIKKGADINLRDNPSGYTALMHAINNK